MRFSLQDVKKQVHRRKGELAVSLHFLRPGEYQNEIERLLAYHERLLDQPQGAFSRDEARACVGDYRLAACLIATLSAWYSWQQPAWEQLMQDYGDETAALLEIDTITTPTHLRLALFSYVNEHYHGFVDSSTRASVLETFAAGYQLSLAQLEYLLALDSEEEAVLVRETPQPPEVQDVATLYNQWVFEAALFNASSVRFVIDCAAFEQQSETGSGVGTAIKRLCYLARKRGVYYDISYDNDEGSGYPGSSSLHLRLTLYGPQEMTGAAQQYGLRLAQLCRMLLGYRQKTGTALFPAKAILEAEATIHFLQRAYNFAITNNVLSLLPPLPSTSATNEISSAHGLTSALVPATAATSATSAASTIFDSSIEHIFAETFASLETSYAVDGWSLVREPEPLLLERSIFIPDFALTRNARRIYMEILGFWTPSYRERKVQKLQQLRGRGDIALAIPIEAREAFTSIADYFPIVYYSGQLSATDVLQLLRTHFDDVAERLASIDSVAVRQQVAQQGWIPERTCYSLLHCYRRSELAQAAERIVDEKIAFSPGIGLYTRDWLEHLRISFVEWLGALGVVSLANVLRECRTRWRQLATVEDATLEALFSLWPEVQVKRSSIFDATVAIEGASNERTGEMSDEEAFVQQAPVKKAVRERKTTYKKHTTTETQQGDLWG